MDILRTHLPRVFYAQGFEALEDSPLIALAQLLQTLDVILKEPCVFNVVDSLIMCVYTPESSLQLTVLPVRLLPFSGVSSRSHHHVEYYVCPGVVPPLPPRQPALLRWRNQLCCLQYDWCKYILHIINIAAAWGCHPEVVHKHCCYFLVLIRVIRQPSPSDRRRSLWPPHWYLRAKRMSSLHVV